MKAICGYIEEAKGSIQVDNALSALEFILQMLGDIDSSLPGVEEFDARQAGSAKFIKGAEDFECSHR